MKPAKVEIQAVLRRACGTPRHHAQLHSKSSRVQHLNGCRAGSIGLLRMLHDVVRGVPWNTPCPSGVQHHTQISLAPFGTQLQGTLCSNVHVPRILQHSREGVRVHVWANRPRRENGVRGPQIDIHTHERVSGRLLILARA